MAIMDLKIAVEVGLVEGTMPISSPTGVAISITCAALSSEITPIVFISLIALYRSLEARWFL